MQTTVYQSHQLIYDKKPGTCIERSHHVENLLTYVIGVLASSLDHSCLTGLITYTLRHLSFFGGLFIIKIKSPV